MRVRLNVDFDYSKPTQESLALIERHNGRIENYTAEGPAGGNPNLDLSFPSRAHGLNFLREHSPDDSSTFANSRLTDVPAPTLRTIIYLREIDAGTDAACWTMANKTDPTAVPFVPASG